MCDLEDGGGHTSLVTACDEGFRSSVVPLAEVPAITRSRGPEEYGRRHALPGPDNSRCSEVLELAAERETL